MRIPILLYHKLFDNEFNRERYAIRKEEFERQIQYLSENGFQSLSVENFCNAKDSINEKKRAIIITFDDGNFSDYSISFPILNKYGFIATFFVTVGWVGNKNYVNWSHLKEMVSEGMSVQSHGLTHCFLSALDKNTLRKELIESKIRLEDKLNRPIEYISMPGGFYSKIVLNIVKESGYKGVCTSRPGMNDINYYPKKFYILNRFVMTKEIDIKKYKMITSGDKNRIVIFKAQYYFKSMIKRIIGSRRYYEIWKKYFRKV